jgi:beta-glucosidase
VLKEQQISVARNQFPLDFAWGVATAAYQIEGATVEDGRKPSIWDTFSATPGKTYDNQTGDIACDHYHLYKEDVKLMRELGLNSYRFSISWSRVIPQGRGVVNQAGLDFYDNLVNELLANGIEPYVTLYHWDLPQVLQDQGGWKVRETAEAFAEYVEVVTARLGDRVKGWITLNEPWVAAVNGHIIGEHAPGETDLETGVRAAHHLLLAHGLALPVIRKNMRRPDAEVGITLSTTYVEPGNETEEAKSLAGMVDVISNRWFLDPLFKGAYPAEMLESFLAPMFPIQPGDMKIISRKVDFLGINYYFRTMPVAIEDLATFTLKMHRPEDSVYTAMDWEVYPQGLYKLLTRIHSEYQPAKLFITENGAAFEDILMEQGTKLVVHDPARTSYLMQHFHAASEAIKDGVPLAGYFIWSLYDNFEWSFGTSKRFGIVYLDYPTQRRIVKDSGYWYQQFLKGEAS